MNFVSSIEWVNELRENLANAHEVMKEREKEDKRKMKERYDIRAVERTFEIGQMVLVHTPEMAGKLDTVWEGPYEIIKIISPTTYRLSVPDRRCHEMIVHVNRLKEWKTPKLGMYRVVVADEVEGDDESIGKIKMGESKLSEEHREELREVLERYKDVITERLGNVRGIEHEIRTGISNSIRCPPYRLAPGWRQELRKEVMDLLKEGILVHSQSAWSAPMVPIRKPNGAIRLCIDYRKLNSVTQPDPYQIPRVDDMLDKVAEAVWLTKLDMNKGYYQVPMSKDSVDKTAFCTPWGKFAFRRMPFGLRNAPTTFQRCMDNTLVNLPHANSYVDDILVHSSSWGEHLIHIQEVLEQLRKVGFTAKPSKCVWGARALTYLGHEVGGGVVRVPELRVKAIKDFRLPWTKRDLRAFLGTVGYYRSFVPEFGGRAQPLNHALRKEAPEVIDWDVGKLQSIEYLKTILCSNNILWLPRGDDFFILHTDASRQGIGAVLSTVRDREERPLGYFSRKLTTAESNYTVSELECLAVVRAVDAFAIHLHGRKFRIVTDHRALTALNTSLKLNGRLLRWALALQAYFFDVQHLAGVNHNNADGLLRQAWQEVDSIPDKDSKAEIKRDRLSPREGGCQGPTS